MGVYRLQSFLFFGFLCLICLIDDDWVRGRRVPPLKRRCDGVTATINARVLDYSSRGPSIVPVSAL